MVTTCFMNNVCKFDATTPLCYWAITVTTVIDCHISNREKSHFDDSYQCLSLILSKIKNFPTKSNVTWSVRIPVIYVSLVTRSCHQSITFEVTTLLLCESTKSSFHDFGYCSMYAVLLDGRKSSLKLQAWLQAAFYLIPAKTVSFRQCSTTVV